MVPLSADAAGTLWPALVAVDVERWYGKGEHSAARLRLDLDDESWSRFSRGARIVGKGRARCISVHVVDMAGNEIAARIRACRADSHPETRHEESGMEVRRS